MFSVTSMGLGSNLARLRKAKDWTLDDLEERSGVGRSVIHAIEKRNSKTSVHAPKLAAAFDITVDDLLSDEPVESRHVRTSPRSVADPELHQAMDDLEDLKTLDPETRDKLLSDLHNAADRARAIAERAKAQRKPATALMQRSSGGGGGGKKSTLSVTLGDGNPLQASLPLLSTPDPFSAEPSQRELELYERIARSSGSRR